MPSSRPNGRRRIEHRERIQRSQARSARRARRFALLVLLAGVFVVALVLTAADFGGTNSQPVRLSSPLASAQARPAPEIVALRGPVHIQLPIAQGRVTAIGYSAASDALPLA